MSSLYTPIVIRLAEEGLLYATADRGPDDTLKEALLAGLGPDETVINILKWTLAGQRSGHEWFVCPECAELRLMRVKAARSCTTNTPDFAPRCHGFMARVAKRPILTAKLRGVLG